MQVKTGEAELGRRASPTRLSILDSRLPTPDSRMELLLERRCGKVTQRRDKRSSHIPTRVPSG